MFFFGRFIIILLIIEGLYQMLCCSRLSIRLATVPPPSHIRVSANRASDQLSQVWSMCKTSANLLSMFGQSQVIVTGEYMPNYSRIAGYYRIIRDEGNQISENGFIRINLGE